jgi:hypothetical protein
MLHWTATRRDGSFAGGAVEGRDAGTLAERLWTRGYKTASITYNGTEVGGVGPHPDTLRRIWWGTEVDPAPRCEAEPVAGMQCRDDAAWTVHIHSPYPGHASTDMVWRVLCPDHAVELFQWVQRLTARDGTVPCVVCGAVLTPDEWLIDHQDMDILGWIEWRNAHPPKEGTA